ncbi:general substrate transporter [Lipomyces kononenkoae]|uniref:General substrate transporter n=1 Tax=Lipomyces kononenkoae TaxID=34357 RepID=A0ACC3SRH2_LIPKO
MASIPTFKQHLYYALAISFTGFTYGWEVASMGGVLAMPQFLDWFGNPSAFRQGAMTAALIAGEFAGSLLIGFFLADRFGRRKTIFTAIAIYLIGQAIVVASQSQAMFIAGRVVNGLGAGGLIQTIPLYTAEITPPKIRGRILSMLNSGIAIGLVVAYWVQYGALNISGNGAWQVCFGLQLVPAAIVAVVMLFRPESPRWLVRHDRSEEALQVLAKLHGECDADNVIVRAEFEEIKVSVEMDNQIKPPSYPTLIFGKQYRRRTALAMGIQFMQQVSGVNIILYYAAKVFAQTGQGGTSAALLSNGIGSALFLGATLSMSVFIDHIGRRRPLFVGPALAGFCLIVVGAMLLSFGQPYYDNITQAIQFNFQNKAAGNAAIAFMFLFEIVIGFTFNATVWTYQNEVFSINARGRGTALATATNWFTNYWLGLFIPEALNKAGWKLYFIFGAINVTSSVVIFLFYPETCLRTLEELDLLFTRNRTVFAFMDREACTKGSMLLHTLAEGQEASATDIGEALKAELVMGGAVRVNKKDLEGIASHVEKV